MTCEEKFTECVVDRQARVEQVLDEAQPYDTNKDLAERAGVSERTINNAKAKRLQTAQGCVDCNKPPDPDLETADPDVKEWIAAFAAWPPKKKKRAYAIFLKLTALGVILK